MPRKILFLTSTNLACNPRCLKEVRLLVSAGMRVTVVAFNLHNWTTPKELELNGELGDVSFHYLEAGRRPLFPWLFASLLEKICRVLQPRFAKNGAIAAIAISKRSWSLLRWVKKNKTAYDLIIAHNPPAFYAAARLAETTSTPFALDIEDYHPGEGHDPLVQRSSSLLLSGLLKRTVYASFAAPLIKTYTQRLPGVGEDGNFVVVNNTFPHSDFSVPAIKAPDEKLRIVWFSQFIDYGRGLEKILPVLDTFAEEIQLTLIGSARKTFLDQEIAGRGYVRQFDSLPQAILHKELANYDVGLALEDGIVDLNRNICLTNKIWSYLLAGLYIIASDTEAQRKFLEKYAFHGVCFTLSEDQFSRTVADTIRNRAAIRAAAGERYERAAAAGWENESKMLLKQWKGLAL